MEYGYGMDLKFPKLNVKTYNFCHFVPKSILPFFYIFYSIINKLIFLPNIQKHNYEFLIATFFLRNWYFLCP